MAAKVKSIIGLNLLMLVVVIGSALLWRRLVGTDESVWLTAGLILTAFLAASLGMPCVGACDHSTDGQHQDPALDDPAP